MQFGAYNGSMYIATKQTDYSEGLITVVYIYSEAPTDKLK